MEKALKIIGQSALTEQDDTVFVCSICRLTFSSLYNKQSHYSGKLHLQTLLQYIDELMRQDATPMKLDCSDEAAFVSSSLENVAVDYSSKLQLLIINFMDIFLFFRFIRRKVLSQI